MHALTDRLCFGRVVEAAGSSVTPARESLNIPLFYLPNGTPTDIGDVTAGRIPASLPEERVLNEIVNIPKNQSDLRARWSGGVVTIFVDGERMESMPRGLRVALRSRHASFNSTVEVWGNCEGEAVLLACDTFSLIDGDDDLTRVFELPGGTSLTIHAIVRGNDESPVLTFCVAYGVDADTNGDGFPDGVEIGAHRLVLIIPIDLDRPARKEIELPPTRAP